MAATRPVCHPASDAERPFASSGNSAAIFFSRWARFSSQTFSGSIALERQPKHPRVRQAEHTDDLLR
jgi:hypothetical protein